jgi:hypothetical protein
MFGLNISHQCSSPRHLYKPLLRNSKQMSSKSWKSPKFDFEPFAPVFLYLKPSDLGQIINLCFIIWSRWDAAAKVLEASHVTRYIWLQPPTEVIFYAKHIDVPRLQVQTFALWFEADVIEVSEVVKVARVSKVPSHHVSLECHAMILLSKTLRCSSKSWKSPKSYNYKSLKSSKLSQNF